MPERDEFSPSPLSPEDIVRLVREAFPWFLSGPDEDSPDSHEGYLTQDHFLHLYRMSQEDYEKYIAAWREVLEKLQLDSKQARAMFEPMIEQIVGGQITPIFPIDLENKVEIVSFYVENMDRHDFYSKVYPSLVFNNFRVFPPPLTSTGEIFTGWLSKPLISSAQHDAPTVEVSQPTEPAGLGQYL